VERGYASTTVNHIAEEAGVALQTVYSSVGPKPSIVFSLIDLIDEEAGLGELTQLAMAETDPRRVIAWAVRIPYMLVERSGDAISVLMSAAAVEADAAKALQEGWTRHSLGRLQMARKLIASGAVRPGLTLDGVDAALALTTWNGQQFQARNGLGWSGPTWERWCVKFFTDALLGSPVRLAGRSPAWRAEIEKYLRHPLRQFSKWRFLTAPPGLPRPRRGPWRPHSRSRNCRSLRLSSLP
jgi:AcrR family transcriptional regulator